KDLRQVILTNLEGWGRQVSVLKYPPLVCTPETSAACLGADEKTLLTGGRDGTVSLWNLATGQVLLQSPVRRGQILAIALSPDGINVLTGEADGRAYLWNLVTGQELNQFRHDRPAVYAVAFSPDGKAILTGGGDDNHGDAILWDATTGNQL